MVFEILVQVNRVRHDTAPSGSWQQSNAQGIRGHCWWIVCLYVAVFASVMVSKYQTVEMLMDEEPRLVQADTFRKWWDRLVVICPPHAPLDKDRCDTAWAALAIIGQEAGAIPK